MRYPEKLDTGRLTVRRIRDEDEESFGAIWADPYVWQALRPGTRYDRQHAARRFRHHLDHWQTHGFGLWMVVERETGLTSGWAGPAHPDFVPGLTAETEIGWSLRRPFWGRGLATEAAQAAVSAAREHLRPARLISLIDPANARSIAVAERLGMRREELVVHEELDIELGLYTLAACRGAVAGPPTLS
jgi:RimJ/RimL family protein N-acetyltransferase